MSLQSLPIGTQYFPDLILGGFVYVDKTKYIYDLVKGSKGAYFLSRPRRFGKSLLVSTLEAIFKGNKELFEGLWIESSDYNWQEYPVIRLDFSQIETASLKDVSQSLQSQLAAVASKNGLAIEDGLSEVSYFRKMFEELEKQGKKAAILIDEYDKPIIDNINNPEKAEEIRLLLRDFYTIIKAQDANVRFVLLTGVSKFAKMSVFSGLNNLNDITMDSKYASILGYTQEELEHYFAHHIDELAALKDMTKTQMLDKIKHWYNGYYFSKRSKQGVYNPFSTLLLFDKKEFANYWIGTGKPTLLVNLMKRKGFTIADGEIFRADEDYLSIDEIAGIDPVAVLYQTGYLTIDNYEDELGMLNLRFPNFEVRRSFLKSVLGGYGSVPEASISNTIIDIWHCLENDEIEEFFEHISSFLAAVPYDISINHEKYYQTIFFCVLTLLGVHIEVEVSTNKGRIDTVIYTKDRIYIIEFKLNGTKEEALQQIKDKGYAQKYKTSDKQTIIMGVEFSKDMRNISRDGWVVEES